MQTTEVSHVYKTVIRSSTDRIIVIINKYISVREKFDRGTDQLSLPHVRNN